MHIFKPWKKDVQSCMKKGLKLYKYSSVFRENRCPPPPKPVYGGNFSQEAVTLKTRSLIYICLQIW